MATALASATANPESCRSSVMRGENAVESLVWETFRWFLPLWAASLFRG